MNWGSVSKQWAFILSPAGMTFMACIGCWIAYLFEQSNRVSTALGWAAVILFIATLFIYAEGKS